MSRVNRQWDRIVMALDARTVTATGFSKKIRNNEWEVVQSPDKKGNATVRVKDTGETFQIVIEGWSSVGSYAPRNYQT